MNKTSICLQVFVAALCATGGLSPVTAFAAQTDISSTPIASTRSAQVKPNIMLLMDTSKSMGWTHMPDDVEGVNSVGIGYVGYKSAQCNVLYYNPKQKYEVPKLPDGTRFPTPVFSDAPYAGFASYFVSADTEDRSRIDLSTSFKAYDGKTLLNSSLTDSPKPAYYYVYTGTQTLSYASAPCTDTDTGVSKPAVGGNWTRVVVGPGSGPAASDERENFAVWYSYYRTRIGLTKSAASLAFTPLTDSFRVGFITVQPKDSPTDSAINPAKYVAISDFDSAQRNTWFSKLFSQTPFGASPSREGLARVGRHYAGKQDSINNGMTGDPVQYSCQQNFTIMTTDGYWNSQTETPNRGPVDLGGVNLVGNRDNKLTDATMANNLTPRPIWEGAPDSFSVLEDNRNNYSYADCGTWADRSTTQALKSTSQIITSKSQLTLSTLQNLSSTSQKLQSTNQNLQSTTQVTLTTTQNRQSTNQKLKSTTQNLRNTSQNVATNTQVTQTVTIVKQSTVQNRQSTNQNRQSTTQTTQTKSQKRQSTSQVLKTTTQNLRSTSQPAQITQSTSRTTQSTLQINQSTAQTTITTAQVRQSTSQLKKCDAALEQCSFVANCIAGGTVTCETISTGPSLVATCSPTTPDAGNNYLKTTCLPSGTGPTAGLCTPAGPTAGNSYTTTTCNSVNTGPTPVGTCTPIAAGSGNNWKATTCSNVPTGPTAVSTCSAQAPDAGNNQTQTTCAPVNDGPTVVPSCAASGPNAANSYTTTTCGSIAASNTTNVPVPNCTATGPTAANGNTTTTCSTNNTTNVPAATCAASGPTAANSYTTTTCPAPIVTTNVDVSDCTASGPNAGNNYTLTTCPAPVVTGPTGVDTCVASGPSGAITYSTSCAPKNTSNVPVAACTMSGRTAANNWIDTTCPAAVVTTNVPVATCTPATTPTAANNYTTTTCPAAVVTTNVPVAACAPSGPTAANNFTSTTCATTTVSGPTVVAACTPVAPTAANGYQRTSCGTATATTPVAVCVPAGPTAANGYTTTTCATNNTTNVPVATCTPSGPTAANAYTTTTCPAPVVTANVPVAACTASGPTAGNNFTTTTCPAPVVTTNVPVATCTASGPNAGNAFTTITCPAPVINGPTGVPACAPVPAIAGNSFTTTTCGTNNTTNDPVATCTASGPTSLNGYTTTTCPAPVVTTNVPVGSCAASGPTGANSYTTTTCPAPVVTANVPVASCDPEPADAGNNFTTTTCPAPIVTGPMGAASCVPDAASAGNNWKATICATVTSDMPSASCAAVGAAAGNSYTAITCSTNITTDVPGASCAAATASAGNAWTAATCRTDATGPTLVPSCTPETASAATNWVATTCVARPGKKLQFSTTKTVTTSLFNNGLPIGVPSVVTSPPTSLTDVDGACFQPGTEPALPVSRASGGGQGPNPPAGCSGWPCSTTNAATGGSENSLADVAQYYYITNLRKDLDPTDWPITGARSVPSIGSGPEDDRVNWQHMTTFTIGLGVSGTLNYSTDYRTSIDPTSDFQKIRDPLISKPWPLWPDPANYVNFDSWNNPRSIDDFWHTAVNGRGRYFSAANPNAVIAGLSGALDKLKERPSTGAAAGTSSLQPVAGDNLVFVGSYVTGLWTGDVKGGQIDTSSGEINPAVSWSAQALLDSKVSFACDTRNIYLMRAGAPNNMVNFTANTFACDGAGLPAGAANTGLNAAELAYFGAASVSQLSQYPSMTDGTFGTVDQRTDAAGEKLVNYLRGQRGAQDFEAGVAGKLFRTREHVLGDVVGGQPVYVRAPRSTYQDAGYQAFKAANANRTPMVYVAANDGMLHALYAGSASVVDPNAGKEAWAVIPSVLLPNLYKLADNDYGSVHQFYVDGTPVAGDVRDASTSTWKTMLVGGLNAGGKGYYALDITDPAAPKTLWEFKFSATCYDGSLATAGADCHLGLTFGKPVITKIVASGYPEGRWVVLVTSGYNNVRGAGAAGDGVGYLYVLDAINGNIVYKIATTDGSPAAPSGLAQVNAYIEDGSVNNAAVRVYGGDMLGNIWRFDVNDTQTPSGREATLLGQATSATGTPQPITTRPELAELNGKPFVFVGTGRLLGTSDFGNNSVQSVYGISDKLTGAPVYSNLRTALKPLVLQAAGADRTTACTASTAACDRTDGWVIDLPDAGERVNIDMKLVVSTLTFASNIPDSDACSVGGSGWFNQVDFATGAVVGGSGSGNVVSKRFADGLIVGYGVVQDTSGRYRAIVRTTDPTIEGRPPVCTDCKTEEVKVQPLPPTGRRISWREITQ